jgi:hypothetical protein
VSEIESRWAWSRVEAAADGTLAPAERRRMRDALAADARLREAVDRTAVLRAGLRRLRAEPVPPSLWLRLLRMPRGARPATAWRPRRIAVAGIGLAVAAVAAVAVFALLSTARRQDATRESQEQAVAEFSVAMAYLRRSVTVASDQSASAVRGSLAPDRAAQDGSQPSNGD